MVDMGDDREIADAGEFGHGPSRAAAAPGAMDWRAGPGGTPGWRGGT